MKHSPFCLGRAAGSAALLVLFSSPLGGQQLKFSLAAAADNLQLGSGFAVLGDLNGDGIDDLAVADKAAGTDGLSASGAVYLVSGADGSFIGSHRGTPAQAQYFGVALATLDADGDGLPDLAVGAPGHDDGSGYGAGAVWIYSGAGGAVLSMVAGPPGSQYGSALANAGDQDGDGRDDLFVGAPRGDGARGLVFVQSGADGSTLASHALGGSLSAFGGTLATLGDIDGDGRPELAAGAPGFQAGSTQAGRVFLVRSSDGGVEAEISGAGFYSRLGDSLATVSDTDGDGLADLLVGSYSGGTARLVSGADFSTLVDLGIADLPAFQPLVVGGGLDLDGDGVEDWLLGSPGLHFETSPPMGGVRVVSGADRSELFHLGAGAPFTGLGTSHRVLPGFGFAAGATSLVDDLSGGRGLAHFWQVETADEVVDTDGDGVPDDEDAVPDSIMTPTVVVLGVNSRVENRVDDSGTTLADRYAALGVPADYARSAFYLLSSTLLTLELWSDGLVSRSEARRLMKASIYGFRRSLKAR